ncbi:type II citrate synthase [Halioglobus sp. HI00S01]|uniref:type II citrate synthase n=1 Tax=Halioglobus sp. HI00S01 TaxID=1822214 RepID=UPI0007C30B12|nr:type II citrate synthase [Halioglobus sp. HI00S01]KZX58239.1 type II citrate synthase [Halioglobus sp. HI00S01]
MPEIKREVRPVEVNYLCDKCNQGMMAQCGSMDETSGDIEHRCLICDHKQTFQWRAYPRIDYVGADEAL